MIGVAIVVTSWEVPILSSFDCRVYAGFGSHDPIDVPHDVPHDHIDTCWVLYESGP